MTGQEKAAVLLATLSPELRQQVLERLGALGEQLRERLAALERQPPDEALVRAVTGELELALHRPSSPRPHWQQLLAARARAAYGAGTEETEGAAAEDKGNDLPRLIHRVQSLDARQVVKALVEENPGAIALVLQLLDPGYAARVMAELPADLAAAVSQRLVTTRPLPTPLAVQVLTALLRRLDAQRSPGKEPPDERVAWLAQAVRRMSPVARVNLLGSLAQQNPALARTLRQLVYRIDDLVGAPDRIVQRVVQRLDARAIAAVLSAADSLARAKILRVLPERVRNVVRDALDTEEFEAEEVERANERLIETICELERQGEEVLS